MRALACGLAALASCGPGPAVDPFGDSSSVALPGGPARALAPTPGWSAPVAAAVELDGVVRTLRADLDRALSLPDEIDPGGSPRALVRVGEALVTANAEGSLGASVDPSTLEVVPLSATALSLGVARFDGAPAVALASADGVEIRGGGAGLPVLVTAAFGAVAAIAGLADDEAVAADVGGALTKVTPSGATPWGETCASPQFLRAADLDGDGANEVLVGCDAALEVVEPDGRRELGGVTGRAYDAAVADLDGDGAADVAAVDAFSHELLVWTRAGEPPLRRATRRGPVALVLVDLDGDGQLDAIVSSYEERALEIHWGTKR